MKLIVTFPEERKEEVVKSLQDIVKQVDKWSKTIPAKATMGIVKLTTGSTAPKFAMSEYYLVDKNKIYWKLVVAMEFLINPEAIASRLNNDFRKRLGEGAKIELWKEKSQESNLIN